MNTSNYDTSHYQKNPNRQYQAVFWVEVDKIRPNPYQPRKEFDEAKLRELAESIRQYGVLQPVVVTRHEETSASGGIQVYYELISGERRTRAARLAGVQQVPVLIREGDAAEASERLKLELAIIENLQREDLSPVERARAFKRLVEEFGFKHGEVAKKVGKSREYVTNTIRLLLLPEEMITALEEKKISEGHTRPLLMLSDRREEQEVLFKDIVYKRLSVRESELSARAIAKDRARKPLHPNPEFTEIENELTERLGTRVRLEEKDAGGKIIISFFSNDDLRHILDTFIRERKGETPAAPPSFESLGGLPPGAIPMPRREEVGDMGGFVPEMPQMPAMPDDGSKPQVYTVAADVISEKEQKEAPAPAQEDTPDEDLYSIKHFTV